ncbi:MAG: SPOR domain-containing protein [Proteobacteria bacterium]|nr:SPOR domain-containing protein [Pseudomonadota bacterium]
MAERSNAPSKKTQDAAQDVTTLQKRGRRRLVGAIALVLLAVIILPMVFDPEPRPNAPLVSVRIPSEDGSKFTPKIAGKPSEAASQPAETKPEEKAGAKAPEPAAPAAAPVPEPAKPAVETAKAEEKPAATVAAKPAPKPAPKPVPKPVEKPAAKAAEKPAEKPAEKVASPAKAGEQFMVQVGAFASPDKVREITGQLKEAKLPHYTESVATAKGPVTRVRLGPFASKDAAEKARERAKALGLNPANPVVK